MTRNAESISSRGRVVTISGTAKPALTLDRLFPSGSVKLTLGSYICSQLVIGLATPAGTAATLIAVEASPLAGHEPFAVCAHGRIARGLE